MYSDMMTTCSMFMSMCIYARMYACIYVIMCVCVYVCMYACMYVFTYVRMYVCTYVPTHARTHVGRYVCMYIMRRLCESCLHEFACLELGTFTASGCRSSTGIAMAFDENHALVHPEP